MIHIGYTNSDFQSDLNFRKSTSGCVFTLGGGAICRRSVKQSCIANSTMEAKYFATYEATKDAVWLKKFISNLGVVRMEQVPIILFWDNSGAVAQSKDPRNHKKEKLIERKYHIIWDTIARGDVVIENIESANNLADPFTKTLSQKTFE